MQSHEWSEGDTVATREGIAACHIMAPTGGLHLAVPSGGSRVVPRVPPLKSSVDTIVESQMWRF